MSAFNQREAAIPPPPYSELYPPPLRYIHPRAPSEDLPIDPIPRVNRLEKYFGDGSLAAAWDFLHNVTDEHLGLCGRRVRMPFELLDPGRTSQKKPVFFVITEGVQVGITRWQ